MKIIILVIGVYYVAPMLILILDLMMYFPYKKIEWNMEKRNVRWELFSAIVPSMNWKEVINKIKKEELIIQRNKRYWNNCLQCFECREKTRRYKKNTEEGDTILRNGCDNCGAYLFVMMPYDEEEIKNAKKINSIEAVIRASKEWKMRKR